MTAPEPEPMEDDRRCRALALHTGKRCRRFPVPGATVCVMHGGAAPQVRAAAARRLEEARATALLEAIWNPLAAPITDPVASLLSLAGQLRHAVDVLGARVSVSEDLDGAAATAWTRVLRELRQALVEIERLDLTAKQIAISEQTGQMLAAVIRVVLDRLELTDAQRVLALQVVPEELRALGARSSGG